MFVKVRKWAEFQHYKDRCPPWIKLHHSILDDFEFQSLPVASRALAPSIWLIASEHKEGLVDANYEKLAFRLRQTARQIEDALTPLIERGFLLVEPDASNTIADCQQSAVPETEAETYKQEREKALSAKADAVSILEFLNEKTGKAFQPVPANLELILARLKESTPDDIRSVVALKCRQWTADEKMAEYLRPATLFNRQKYAQYIGELKNAVS